MLPTYDVVEDNVQPSLVNRLEAPKNKAASSRSIYKEASMLRDEDTQRVKLPQRLRNREPSHHSM